MCIYLVRHGESVANRDGLLSGVSDHPLSDQGRRQAEAAAERFREMDFHRVFTSRLSRAIDTCDILLAASGARHGPVDRLAALNERGFGELEGSRFAPLDSLDRDDPRRRAFEDLDYRPDGGESPREAYRRAVDVLQSTLLPAARQGNILVVAHGNILRCMVVWWMDWPLELAVRVPSGNCQVTRLRLDGLTT